MRDWLRNLDDRLFSPPHTFQTIAAFVSLRLSLEFPSESNQPSEREMRPAAKSEPSESIAVEAPDEFESRHEHR